MKWYIPALCVQDCKLFESRSPINVCSTYAFISELHFKFLQDFSIDERNKLCQLCGAQITIDQYLLNLAIDDEIKSEVQ